MSYIPRLAEPALSEMLRHREVALILGARQVGKTTLAQRVIPSDRSLYLSLDLEIDQARLNSVRPLAPMEALLRLGSPSILVLDEAQQMPEVGRLVKGWYDARLPVKVVLLGSSSLNLLDRSAEPLTGRNEKLILTPLAFAEALQAQDWYSPSLPARDLAGAFSEQAQSALLQQMVYGSYPAAVLRADRDRYLTNLTTDYLLRDVLQLGSVRAPGVVRRLLLLLAYQVGSEVSTSELATGLGVARQTIERYLDLLEASFVIFRLPAFCTNPRKEVTKSQKVYFWDTGVRNALLREFAVSRYRSDIGPLFENFVVAEFAKHHALRGDLSGLHFWRSRDGGEVDLVVTGGGGLRAYEVKWSSSRRAGRPGFSNQYGVPVQPLDRRSLEILLEPLGSPAPG